MTTDIQALERRAAALHREIADLQRIRKEEEDRAHRLYTERRRREDSPHVTTNRDKQRENDISALRAELASVQDQQAAIKKISRQRLPTNTELLEFQRLQRKSMEIKVRLDELLPEPSPSAQIMTDEQREELAKAEKRLEELKGIASRSPNDMSALMRADEASKQAQQLRRKFGLPINGRQAPSRPINVLYS